ncbi:hypothetical protein OG203_05655 [Nocardia sp. NBC_01499]|uniref:hypothetical protein n=1 Tax=Nocardia sp. NBC_01499 TaxID=2903597 RepID=UPI00386A47E8
MATDAGTSPIRHAPTDVPESGIARPSWLDHGVHAHADGQLVHAASGVLATTTERVTWVAPANRAMWTPPDSFTRIHAIRI